MAGLTTLPPHLRSNIYEVVFEHIYSEVEAGRIFYRARRCFNYWQLCTLLSSLDHFRYLAQTCRTIRNDILWHSQKPFCVDWKEAFSIWRNWNNHWWQDGYNPFHHRSRSIRIQTRPTSTEAPVTGSWKTEEWDGHSLPDMSMSMSPDRPPRPPIPLAGKQPRAVRVGSTNRATAPGLEVAEVPQTSSMKSLVATYVDQHISDMSIKGVAAGSTVSLSSMLSIGSLSASGKEAFERLLAA